MNVGGVPVHVAGETLLCADAGLAATQRNHGILRSAAPECSGRRVPAAGQRSSRAIEPAVEPSYLRSLKVQTQQPPRGRGRRRHKQKGVAAAPESRV